MKDLMKTCLIKVLDEGSLPLVFVKPTKRNGYSADCELTDMGEELVNTTICLAKAKRNDETVTTGEGHINKVSDYESWGGNFGKVQNFSDCVAFDNMALRARKFVTETKLDLTYDEAKVVSPIVHKNNIAILGDKSKARKEFATTKVDKVAKTMEDMPYIYKDINTFYQHGESGDNSVPKELVWLRKVFFKIQGMDDYLTTITNWSDEEEFFIWAVDGMLKA